MSLIEPFPKMEPRAGDAAPWNYLLEEARIERQKIEGRYDEAIGFSMPGRQGFSRGPDDSQQFDDTAIIATPEFASNIQQGIMPNFARWASHIAGVLIDDEAEKEAVTIALQQVDTYMFDLINSSNAATEINEAILDLALGTGCLRVDEGLGPHPLNTRAVPQRALLFTVGPDGQPDAIFEERMLTVSQIDVDYPDATMPDELLDAVPGEKPARLHVIEGWRRDWTDPKSGKMNCVLIMPAYNNFIALEKDSEGVGCSPYVGPFRWSKGSGEAWGRGPLFNLLPSLRTVNFAMSALLEHSDFALAGIWTAEDDGVLNVDTVKLQPGTVIPVAPGSKGLVNVMPGGRFDMQQFMIEEMRKNIRRALYTDQLGDPNRSPKTATEVTQRMSSLSRAIGSSFGRLILELVMPFVQRVIYILKKKGLIDLPEVNGQEIALLPTSPLAQAQKFDDIDSFDRFSGLVAARFGPEAIGLEISQEVAVPWLGERFGIPTRLLRTKDEKTKLAANVAQAQMAASGMGGAGLGGEAAPAETGIVDELATGF
jgi:hypothetical protein